MPTDADCALYLSSLHVSDAQIEAAKRCAQRSPEWHAWRLGAPGLPADRLPAASRTHRADLHKLDERTGNRLVLRRMTMSAIGAACGHKQGAYGTRLALLRDMLWPSFEGNDATDYGTTMEASAFALVHALLVQEYRAAGYAEVWLEETGITISRQYPWMAASSDGLFYACGVADGMPAPQPAVLRGTIEIKCPFSRGKQSAFYAQTPHEYYDQFQGTGHLNEVDVCKFPVYTPNALRMDHYACDARYFHEVLQPAAERFYMREYLPRAIWKDRGMIEPGDIDPVYRITLAPAPPALPAVRASPAAQEGTKSAKRVRADAH